MDAKKRFDLKNQKQQKLFLKKYKQIDRSANFVASGFKLAYYI